MKILECLKNSSLQEIIIKQLSGKASLPLLGLKRSSLTKSFFYKTIPHVYLEVLERYLRVDVEGSENIPLQGAAILLPNHSGYLGLDALLLNHWIYKNRKRIPRILLHRLWFKKNLLRHHAQHFGFLEASYDRGVAALNKKNLLILFPEAEQGNFKTIDEKYKLQRFKSGFVRMAMETGVPVVPVLIIGAEETHINIGQLSILGQLFPLPLNSFPLPAKWKVRFLEPIYFAKSKTPETFDHSNVANQVKHLMQNVLQHELDQRKHIYFP